jgi:hypothetical protein
MSAKNTHQPVVSATRRLRGFHSPHAQTHLRNTSETVHRDDRNSNHQQRSDFHQRNIE